MAATSLSTATADDAEKRAEIAFVRKEKTADESAYKRLTEVYGAARTNFRDEGRMRRWKCGECGYQNYDSRMVCGECLAPNEGELGRRRVGEGGVEHAAATPRLPGTTGDATNCRIEHVMGRCYRTWNGNNSTDEGSSHRSKRATLAAAGAAPRRYDDDFDDNDDDGPPCTTATTSAEDGAASFVDDEDPRRLHGLCQGAILQETAGGGPSTHTSSFLCQCTVPTRFLKFVIGSKGAALIETQRLTGVTITILDTETPSSSSSRHAHAAASPDIATLRLKAASRSAIAAAVIRLESVLEGCKEKADYTHFLSIPLGTISSLRDPLGRLMAMLRDMCSATTMGNDDGEVAGERHLDPSLVQNPDHLHLTLLMLRLHTEADASRAKDVLKSLAPLLRETLAPPNDHVTLQGLNYMNDDPTEVHVVYLELEKNAAFARLQQVIQLVNASFIEASLATERDVAHNEKLHATILNSKWRAAPNTGTTGRSGGGGAVPPRQAFNAVDVFKKFGQIKLGTHKLQRLDLSVLSSRMGADGYFAAADSVPL